MNGRDSAKHVQVLQDWVIAWFDAGLDPSTMSAFRQAGEWEPAQAARWARAGFTVEGALYCDEQCLLRRYEFDSGRCAVKPSTDVDWLDSNLPADWILLSIAAGVHTVDQAASRLLEYMDDRLVAFLMELAADRNGVDVRRLGFHLASLPRMGCPERSSLPSHR